ncbi:MAG: molybdopterin cofactor-binding domain-containing protein, partial [Myxococcota bacterium]
AVASAADGLAVAFTVDGQDQRLVVGPDATALHTLRRGCGRTGTKEGCGAGTCGACTVQIDGVPHVTCLLPALALHGKKVTTVEGIGGAEPWSMHPIQRAFLAHDAMQCGYCTPGFVVEATAFHDRWRAAHGTSRTPTRDEVAAALAGHLCRCGAYENIYAAVMAACAGGFDAAEVVYERVDGPQKVSGRAKYTVDVTLDGMLEGAFFRSPHAHARLSSFDDRAARDLPGVKAIVRLLPEGGRARYAGQEVAAVAAVDAETALRAVRALAATWEVLPAAIGMEAALAPGASAVYGTKKDARSAAGAAEGPVMPASIEGNLRGPTSSSFLARPKAGRKGIDDARATGTVGAGVYRTGTQVHTALEPHAAVARWPTPESIEVWASTQAVTWLADDIADRFELRRDAVVVHAEFVGGGFGAKAGLQVETTTAIELAKAAGAPVRIALDRAEELLVGGYRPSMQIEVAVGMSVNGSLLGVTHTGYSDAGCAVGSNSGLLARILYDSPNKDLDDYDVLTHAPGGCAMRAPSGPPTYFALEGAVDDLAQAAGEDPITVRRRWDPNVPRTALYDWAQALPVWKERGPVAADTGRYRRGVGFASGGWYEFWDPHTQIELSIGSDGIVARCGVQDTGQGTGSVIAVTVAEALGVPVSTVRVEIGDSRFPHGPASAGSRVTASIVPAAQDAAAKLLAELVDLAQERGLGSVVGAGGMDSGGRVIPWSEVVAGVPAIRVVGRRKRDERSALLPISLFDTKLGRVFPGCVNLASVEVDTRLGR